MVPWPEQTQHCWSLHWYDELVLRDQHWQEAAEESHLGLPCQSVGGTARLEG